MENLKRPGVLFFDVNETLLDLSEVKTSVTRALGGNTGLAALWFPTLLQHSLVVSAAGQFRPFGEIAAASLAMVAQSNNIDLSENQAKEAIKPLLSAPLHPDVMPAIKNLHDQGFSMGALTNSSQAAMEQQLKNAGLEPYFDFMLSVEELKMYKPHLQVYQWAAKTRNMPVENSMMIAAHGWDVGGAAWAGMRTAFVARPGQTTFPLAPKPEIIGRDMMEISSQLIEMMP